MSIVSRVCASTLWPGKVPGKISLNNPRTPQKTAAVKNGTQTFREREERRIGYGYGAPFLRMPVLRLRLARSLTREIGVREIIERDDRRPVEQRLDRTEHMVLKRGLVLEEMIRRAVQGHVTQGAKVDPQPFSGSAARTEPGVGRPFRSRLRHPADDIGQRAALLPFVETECTQLIGKIQQLERLQRCMFDTNRPGVAVLEGLDIDPLPVRCAERTILTLQPAFGNPPRHRPFDISISAGSVMKLSVAWFVISSSTRGHNNGQSP